MTKTEFNETTEWLEDVFDLSVSGGRRTKKRNDEVGGVANSYHLKWLAKDWVPDDWDDLEIVAKVCARVGLELIDEKDSSEPHWHVEPAG